MTARRWIVTGRVQGVGFRSFVEFHARELELCGWVRNRDDGHVEAYAVGPAARLDDLAARLHTGPRWSEVRTVEEQAAPMQQLDAFHIK